MPRIKIENTFYPTEEDSDKFKNMVVLRNEEDEINKVLEEKKQREKNSFFIHLLLSQIQKFHEVTQ